MTPNGEAVCPGVKRSQSFVVRGLFASGLRFVFQPYQLQHGIREEKAAASGALPGVVVLCSLHKARSPEEFRGFSAWGGTYKDVIDIVNGGGGHETILALF
jgi:hypothetical protein